MKLRDLRKCNSPNDGSRTLLESILAPEVVQALSDWAKNSKSDGVLLGGLALSFYVKPRYTSDVDFLFLSADQIPEHVIGFKRIRNLAFEHRATGVEVEVFGPSSINMPVELAKDIIATAIEKDGVNVASRAGLIAAKLGRFNKRDQADIEDLLTLGPVDLSPFHLTDQDKVNFEKLKAEL